ncbi:helix-turn-helix domain-containing protein [Marinospirillum sp.]|uniref:AraC family transcriptional regulator n=1 Tax=Marinospirillum sp. TaxID=2183934 RepID=UPI00384C2BFC
MTDLSCPLFWRDARMPYVELRQVKDGRQVCYALHSHSQWSLGAITQGLSEFRYQGEVYPVAAGDLVVVNPHWVHACNPVEDEPWSYLMLYVDLPWLTELCFREGLLAEPVWQDLDTAKLTFPYWYQRYCDLAACLLNPEADLLHKQTHLVDFLTGLLHHLVTAPVQSLPQAPEKMQALAAYLDQRVDQEVSLENLCALSGYSEGHLVRSFKKYFGLTPHAYQVNRRVELGRQELKAGKPIAEAALAAGFADQSHFQRTFKRLMAATPNQYRQVLSP